MIHKKTIRTVTLHPVHHLPSSAPRKPNHDTQRHLPPRARINTSPSRTWNRIASVRPSHRRPRCSGTESCMCTRTTRAGSRCATMRRAFQRATHMTSMCALVSETWYGQTVLGFTSNGCRQRSLRAARARCRTGSDHDPCLGHATVSSACAVPIPLVSSGSA